MKASNLNAAAVAVGALTLSVMSAGDALSVELSAHRALYEITLESVRNGSEITDLRGRMMLEWADACDGWTVNQKVRMVLSHIGGPPLNNEFSFTSFESKEGERFRFSMRSSADGRPYEEFVGTATRGAPAKSTSGGHVEFTLPDGVEIELPEETMFPSEHMFLVVERALAGERMIARTVFSGTGPDSVHEVTAFIGPEIPKDSKRVGAEDPEADDAMLGLTGLRSWPVAMAYFPYEQQELEPEFEVSYRLLENGVAGNLLLDYGEFAMRAVLDKIEFLASPNC